MGILDKLKPKEERLYIDPETKKSEWIPVKKEKPRQTVVDPNTGEQARMSRGSIKELTPEEQFKPRLHPWQTPRGKRVIKGIKTGVKHVDKSIVNYNRNYNPMYNKPVRRNSYTNYSPIDNYNPFGSMFDTGMNYNRPRKKKSSSNTKYYVKGGKAYPIVKKKSSSKNKRRNNNDWDIFNAYGRW